MAYSFPPGHDKGKPLSSLLVYIVGQAHLLLLYPLSDNDIVGTVRLE
jgi:hypothetical protein